MTISLSHPAIDVERATSAPTSTRDVRRRPRGRARDVALPERVWPEDIPTPAPSNSPRILRTLSLRLERYLDRPARWLPALNAANGSRRQQRSERRIACAQLLRAMIKYCDLATLRVGIPAATGWVDLTLPFFAGQAGIGLRRAERALRDLQTAGLAKIRRQCELQESSAGDRYKGLAAIKYLPPALFDAFGMRAWLQHERSRAHLRAQRRAAQQHKRERRAVAAAIEASLPEKSSKRFVEREHARQVADYERSVMLCAAQLKSTHPEWDRDACYAEARRQLAPPT
ncbi:Crp/Fnr family transcriptional regulator [Burkholderia stagnalis]|uniref:Crp/Fnr family transcriptional regulator n=1 Tax=Burkholderia stagnalis TaxID=1503054 RepID=UPI000F80686B|nr:Crp/Fnr family transcriptional regulator [Burkholderia stagnalis]